MPAHIGMCFFCNVPLGSGGGLLTLLTTGPSPRIDGGMAPLLLIDVGMVPLPLIDVGMVPLFRIDCRMCVSEVGIGAAGAPAAPGGPRMLFFIAGTPRCAGWRGGPDGSVAGRDCACALDWSGLGAVAFFIFGFRVSVGSVGSAGTAGTAAFAAFGLVGVSVSDMASRSICCRRCSLSPLQYAFVWSQSEIATVDGVSLT